MAESTFSAKYETYRKNIGKDGMFDSAEELCNVFWAWRMANWPEFATFVGCEEFDDQLNDNTLEAYKDRQEKAHEFMQHCEKLLEKGTLNEEDTLNVKLLREDLKVFTEGAKYQGYLFPICYNEGMQVDFEQLASWMVFKAKKNYENYLARLKALPERISQDIALMEHGIDTGKVHHLHSMKGVLEQCDLLVNVSHPEHTSMWEPFKSFPDCIEEEDREKMKEEALEIITKSIIPAFTKLRLFIENEYMPKCRPKEGISTLEGGAEFYQQCLKFHLSIDLTPQQVHDVGRREVYRIRQLMEEIVKKTGFQGEFREFLHHLRTNQEFYFQSKDELLEEYRNICYNKIRPKLNKFFHKIPESKLIIDAVPESRPDAPAAYYMAGTLDGSRPGKYYVNCNRLEMCPKYDMMTLSLHEGEPGHHFQGMYAVEMKGVPKFRQNMEDMSYSKAPSRFPIHTAYCEGWGLYCEYLGNEMELYDDDLYSLLGHLSNQMLRACRLVIDTGLHTLGYTWFQQEEFLYDMTHPDYKNRQKRKRTYERKCREFPDYTAKQLETMLRSCRTRYGKLSKPLKSGSGRRRLSAIDDMILNHFSFLSRHIRRKTVGLTTDVYVKKEKINEETIVLDSDSCENEDTDEEETCLMKRAPMPTTSRPSCSGQTPPSVKKKVDNKTKPKGKCNKVEKKAIGSEVETAALTQLLNEMQVTKTDDILHQEMDSYADYLKIKFRKISPDDWEEYVAEHNLLIQRFVVKKHVETITPSVTPSQSGGSVTQENAGNATSESTNDKKEVSHVIIQNDDTSYFAENPRVMQYIHTSAPTTSNIATTTQSMVASETVETVSCDEVISAVPIERERPTHPLDTAEGKQYFQTLSTQDMVKILDMSQPTLNKN